MPAEGDTISITSLTVRASIGVHPWERAIKQPLVIDLHASVDLRSAGTTDRLADSVDYAHLAQGVTDLCGARHFNLIETVAQSIADHCLADPRVLTVRVRVAKPSALPGTTEVAVSIER